MTLHTVRTYTKGQIVVPGELRQKYRIKPGSSMRVMDYDGVILLIPPVRNVRKLMGSLPKTSPSLVDYVMKERKREA